VFVLYLPFGGESTPSFILSSGFIITSSGEAKGQCNIHLACLSLCLRYELPHMRRSLR
jgi:hypothetical protein